ncbi:hypothetical protein CLOM_g756 [Closterium sp. NIES-68]|nr:hypothetical protein CLOM_g756 [Closterium sp. NIES-68]GJP79880.1 hypothetical protein CLOP_g10097 [Closterium sp. NIES-67]
MASFEMTDMKKIGIGLTAFGVLFSFLGVIFFFDKGLLAMGNILFLAGVTLTIGLQSTISFFTRRRNRKGSAFFLSGLVLVVIGWPMVGMAIQAYGFVLLFSGFLPTLLVFMQRIPVLGWLLDQPYMRQFLGRFRDHLPP